MTVPSTIVTADWSQRLSSCFITDVKRRADDCSFPNKQLCFLYAATRRNAFCHAESVITLVTVFLHDAIIIFFPPKEDDCIFLHCSSCLDLWTIKHMAEPATDLAFAALLFPIRLLAIEKLWNPPTSIPLSFSPSHPQTTRATGSSRCIVDGCRGGPEEKRHDGEAERNARSLKQFRPWPFASLDL